MIESYNARYQQQSRDRAVALYNAAVFLADSIGKTIGGGQLQSFDKAFPGFDKPRAPMDDDELFQQVLAINAQLGGRVTYGSN